MGHPPPNLPGHPRGVKLVSARTAQSPLAIADEDSDSWWSGVNLNGWQRGLSASAAAFCVSIAAASGSQQNDEISLPIAPAGQDLYQVLQVGNDPIPIAFIADDDIVPQPVQTGLDDYTWSQPYRLEPSIPNAFFAEDDFAPTVSPDEDYILALQAQVPVVLAPQGFVDGEIVPQPVQFGFDEVSWTQPYRTEPTISNVLFADDEWVAQAPFVDEEYTLPLVDSTETVVIVDYPGRGAGYTTEGGLVEEHYWIEPQKTATVPLQIPLRPDDELVTPTIPDEQYLPPALAQIPPLVQLANYANDEIVPQPAPIEEYWFRLVQDPVEIVIVDIPGRGAGLGIPDAQPLPVDEQYWFYLPAQPSTFAPRVFSSDEEIVPAQITASVEPSPFGERFIHKTVFRRLGQVDDIIQIPLQIDELDWEPYIPPLAPPIVSEWDDEQIVPQPVPLNIDESDWEPFIPPLASPCVQAFYADDEIGEFVPVEEEEKEGGRKPGKWPKVTEYITKIKDRFYWFRDENELPKDEPKPALKVAKVEGEIPEAEPQLAERVQAELAVQSEAEVAKRKRIEQMNDAIMKLFL